MKLLMYVLLLLFAPCNTIKKTAQSSEQTTNNVMIVYKTSPCFGKCPVYTLTIDGEKMTATFVGESDTPKIGTFKKSISKMELNDFIKGFEDAHFYSFGDKYLGTIVDFPHRFITYSNNNKIKKIELRSEVPEELTRLEALLITFANSEGWEKIVSESTH